MTTPAIQLRQLCYRYQPQLPQVLHGVDLDVQPGERCLLVGANGAGKTTLLRLVAGQHMIDAQTVRVLGRSAFHDTSLVRDVAFIGGAFPFDVDVSVRSVVQAQRQRDPALQERLVALLGVDPDWSMRFVSDGQRRRVQILLALLRRPKVLLLDEVTTDLDVIARQDLLAYLRQETETRGATILYATHILDALDDWVTHVAYLSHGRLRFKRHIRELPDYITLRAQGALSPLMRMVEAWLRRDA